MWKTPLVFLVCYFGCICTSSVWISEYVEGSSFNKAIKLYNSGSETVDLSAYSIWLASNGVSWPGVSAPLSGKVAPCSTYVVCHTGAEPAILSRCDLFGSATNAVMLFNGNDAVGLVSGTTLVDAVGSTSSLGLWVVQTGTTDDHTIRRSAAVTIGTTNFLASEWLVFVNNDVSDLDSCAGCTSIHSLTEFAQYVAMSSLIQITMVCTSSPSHRVSHHLPRHKTKRTCHSKTVVVSYCHVRIRNKRVQTASFYPGSPILRVLYYHIIIIIMIIIIIINILP